MSLNFTAIDFETANSSRASACGLGVVKVRNGKVHRKARWLLKPTDGGGFSPRNVEIHGIDAAMVHNAPTWAEAYPEILELLEDDVLFAHNASFDMSVLRQTSEGAGVDVQDFRYCCSYEFASRFLQLPNHKLPTVNRALGFSPFRHHDGLEDALACANITVELARQASAADMESLLEVTGYKSFLTADVSHNRSRRPGNGAAGAGIEVPVIPESSSLNGEVVAFTGDLSVETTEAKELVLRHGGQVNKHEPTRQTTLLVVGEWDPDVLRPGAVVSNAVVRAEALKTTGQDLRIVSENAFRKLLVNENRGDDTQVVQSEGTVSAMPDPPEYKPIQWTQTSPALPHRRDVKGMTSLLADLGPVDTVAATFKSAAYGTYRIAGTAFTSPSTGIRMLGHRFLDTKGKPEQDLQVLTILQGEDLEFIESAHADWPVISGGREIGGFGHGDLVIGMFNGSAGPYIVNGLVVHAPIAGFYMLGSMIVSSNGAPGRGLRSLEVIRPVEEHSLEIPKPITTWNLHDSGADQRQ